MNQSVMEKNIRVLPFDGKEQFWHEWSAKFLARADMLGYLRALIKDSGTLPDAKEEPSKEMGHEDECNKIAYNQLILYCEGRAFNIINNAKSVKYPRGDAALAWRSLKNRFQVETAAGKMELKLKFSSLKLQRGQDPDEWLLQLDLLRIRLEDMGSPITNEDFTTHVIYNLTPDYSELVTSLEGNLEELTVDTLKERILPFFRRKSTDNYVNLNQIQVFNREKHPKTYRNTWKPEKGQCYWCLKKGHIVRECKQRLSGKKSTRRPDGTYYQGKLMRETAEKERNTNESFMSQWSY